MGQKVHPKGVRIGIIKKWDSNWFCERSEYTKTLKEDIMIRNYIKKKLYYGAIGKIDIERDANKVMILIHTAKPGVVIGRKGSGIEEIKKEISEMIPNREIYISPIEIEKPELNAQLVAETIAFQLERRVSYRKAIKRAMASSMESGAKGIKVMVSGRIEGAEIARAEWFREGRVPLSTFRADIDYGFAESLTKYGRIGVKVWIYKGDVLTKEEKSKISEIEKIMKEAKESIDAISEESKIS
jgi:small subunit ribosomal protein S3